VDTVILGCGRVGAMVASRLGRTDRVTVVDWNPRALERLPSAFSGQTVVGNGIDVEVLREAGVDSADLFLALTDGDNRNLMSAQIAARLGARRVVARVYDPVRSEIYSAMGITTISPIIKGAERLFQLVVERTEGA